MPYRQHLNAVADLITPYAATRAGFVAQALEKNRRGTPFIQQARDLRAAAQLAANANALLAMSQIQVGLLTAAGVSDKAEGHLQPADQRAAIVNLIENFLLPAGNNFVEELVYRFLLTRGDSLGGAMRNYTGAVAQQRLSAALLARFRNQGTNFQWRREDGQWAAAPDDDAAAALVMKGIHWTVEQQQPRTLIYNLTVPLVRKNIDLCLFNIQPAQLNQAAYRQARHYIALGELKGGIDPAGADEHWKTARTALHRINSGFQDTGVRVHTFFIGAAIVADMANEIWEMLQAHTLENAANLTNDAQLASVVQWLTAL
jgi:hypothetical protein